MLECRENLSVKVNHKIKKNPCILLIRSIIYCRQLLVLHGWSCRVFLISSPSMGTFHELQLSNCFILYHREKRSAAL
jgi:hypothetical protein